MKPGFGVRIIMLACCLVPPTGGVCATAAPVPDDFLIIPGVRIGKLRLPATEEDAMRAYPGEVEPEEIPMPEGALVRGSELFPCNPAGNATLLYDSRGKPRTIIAIQISYEDIQGAEVCRRLGAKHKRQRDPLLKGQRPGDSLGPENYDWQHRGGGEDPAMLPVERAVAAQKLPRNAWHLENGISISTDLPTLQKLNGRPFDIEGHHGDGPGGVLSWRGGRLATCGPGLVFDGAAVGDESRESFSSDDAALRGKPSWIETLTIGTTSVGPATTQGCQKAPQKHWGDEAIPPNPQRDSAWSPRRDVV